METNTEQYRQEQVERQNQETEQRAVALRGELWHTLATLASPPFNARVRSLSHDASYVKVWHSEYGVTMYVTTNVYRDRAFFKFHYNSRGRREFTTPHGYVLIERFKAALARAKKKQLELDKNEAARLARLEEQAKRWLDVVGMSEAEADAIADVAYLNTDNTLDLRFDNLDPKLAARLLQLVAEARAQSVGVPPNGEVRVS